jgi:hypothetical protein
MVDYFKNMEVFMRDPREKDAMLALISTLTVVFVVLFFSLAYFLDMRGKVAVQEARVEAELNALQASQTVQTPKADVAGYETDAPSEDLDYVSDEE